MDMISFPDTVHLRAVGLRNTGEHIRWTTSAHVTNNM